MKSVLITLALALYCVSQPSQEVTPLMECSACKALIQVSLQKLAGRRSELDVTEVLEYICSTANFPGYEFPPPYMQAACEKVIRVHYDDIEDFLTSGRSEVDLDDFICRDSLRVCTVEMVASIKNPNIKPGQDGKYDAEQLKKAYLNNGGSLKVARALDEVRAKPGEDGVGPTGLTDAEETELMLQMGNMRGFGDSGL